MCIYIYIHIYSVYIYIFTVVSINGGTPKSSILDWDFPLYTSHFRGAPDRNHQLAPYRGMGCHRGAG